jgi:hypothetical protein
MSDAERIAYAIVADLIDEAHITTIVESAGIVSDDVRAQVEKVLLDLHDELLRKAEPEDAEVEEWEIEALEEAISPYIDPLTGKISLDMLKKDSRPLDGSMLREFDEVGG